MRTVSHDGAIGRLGHRKVVGPLCEILKVETQVVRLGQRVQVPGKVKKRRRLDARQAGGGCARAYTLLNRNMSSAVNGRSVVMVGRPRGYASHRVVHERCTRDIEKVRLCTVRKCVEGMHAAYEDFFGDERKLRQQLIERHAEQLGQSCVVEHHLRGQRVEQRCHAEEALVLCAALNKRTKKGIKRTLLSTDSSQSRSCHLSGVHTVLDWRVA